MRVLQAGWLLALALLCQGARADELIAASAVSLREPLTEIAARFEALHPGERVRLSFGASNVLAAQIRAGAPIDVLVSADPVLVDDLVRRDLVAPGDHFALAHNTLVVVGSADLPVRLEAGRDLLDPSLRRVAVAERGVPLGHYTRQWLERAGLLEALTPRMVFTEHARATLAAVDYGHADAAVVYATDARLARAARVAFTIAADEQPRITYTAAGVAGRPGAEQARTLLEFLRGGEAREVLTAAGFALPGPMTAQ